MNQLLTPSKSRSARIFGTLVLLVLSSVRCAVKPPPATDDFPRISDTPLGGCPYARIDGSEWVACYTDSLIPQYSNISWSFRVFDGKSYNVMALNEANFSLFLANRTLTGYMLAAGVSPFVYSPSNFTVPSSDKWYIVFQNVGGGYGEIQYCVSSESSPFTCYERAPNATIVTAMLSDDQYGIILTWNALGCGGKHINEFRIYRGTSSGGESYVDYTGLQYWYDEPADGMTYYYQVYAVNDNGMSPASSEVSIYLPPVKTIVIVLIIVGIVGGISVVCLVIHKVRNKYPDPRRW